MALSTALRPCRVAGALSSSLSDVLVRNSLLFSSSCSVSVSVRRQFGSAAQFAQGQSQAIVSHFSSAAASSSSSSSSSSSLLLHGNLSSLSVISRCFASRGNKQRSSKYATKTSAASAAASDSTSTPSTDGGSYTADETLDSGAARVASGSIDQSAVDSAARAAKIEKREARRAEREARKEERLKAKADGTAKEELTKKETLKSKFKSLMHKIVRYKPRTNGMRNKVTIDRSELSKERPIRMLTKGRRKTGGRSKGGSSKGQITVRHRGGGPRLLYRFIDFKRGQLDEPATVVRLEYDPNRTAYIALLRYPDGYLTYIISPQELTPGDVIMSSRTKDLDIKPGNAMPLAKMPVGTVIHNLEIRPGCGAQLIRAAGTSARVLDKVARPGYVLVELSSKEQRFLLGECMAVIGSLSNPLHAVEQLGKAGRNRWKGRRPIVRANAMNPVDHPLGGGFNAKGRQPCGPTGVLSKGFKTRRKLNPLVFVHRSVAKQSARA